ncbi:MAG: hypothetical protein EZS28_016922 [Streblomastix strix]|uniref:Uncharacterized protein n=1 Tax=Streblomastix strix TaxID=222440 RepID=A0A5J4VYE4_9EUKA|nr:MAG: hypothetical protein EZS28_016922 [Streblomastix strix]
MNSLSTHGWCIEQQQQYSANFLNINQFGSMFSTYTLPQREKIKNLSFQPDQSSQPDFEIQYQYNIIKWMYQQCMHIAQHGVVESYQNQFFFEFAQSGLKVLIEQSLAKKFILAIQESSDVPLPDDIYNLARTYMLMMKGLLINNKHLEICSGVIQKSIKSLLSNVTSSQRDKQQDEDESGAKIQQVTNLLQALRHIIDTNREFFIKEGKLYKAISQLVHLNCESKLSCPSCISLPHFPSITELQSSVYDVLRELISDDDDIVRECLIHTHNIFQHLTNVIVSYTNTISLNCETAETQISSTNNTLHPSSAVMNAFKLIKDLLFFHRHTQFAVSSVDLIPSLIKVYRLNEYDNENKAINELKDISSWCLNRVRINNGSKWIEQLVCGGYIRALINKIGTTSGSRIESSSTIRMILINIYGFQMSVIKQSNKHHNIEMNYCINEQIEEEGGGDEFEGHLFHTNDLWDNETVQSAKLVKSMMSNNFISFQNIRNLV